MKITVLSVVGLSKDAMHIYVGLAVFFGAVVLWKNRRICVACLVPVAGAALAMEVLDLYDDHRSMGHFRWGASTHDIINTIFWPCVIVVLSKLGFVR